MSSLKPTLMGLTGIKDAKSNTRNTKHAEKSTKRVQLARSRKPGVFVSSGVSLKPFLQQIKLLKTARTDQKLPSGWFSVSKDMKSNEAEIEAYYQAQLVAIRAAARSAIGNSHVKTFLWQPFTTFTSSAGAAIAQSIPAIPANSAEWAGYANLYDEARVTGLEVHYHVGQTVTNSGGSPAGGIAWSALGYDSTYNSTPNSIQDVLESSHHQLKAIGCNNLSNVGQVTIAPDGHYVFHVKIPQGPVANATPVTGGTGIVANFPGQWMAVGDTGDSVGFLRLYVMAAVGTGVMSMSYSVKYNLEFRERT
jgi:hypothetical protein